jgi:DNA primase
MTVARFEYEFNLTPTEYYSKQFPSITTKRKIAKVICPFHDDTHPSLSINLEDGWYKCHACGAKGGGIAKFHMTRYSLTYKQTITELENFHA